MLKISSQIIDYYDNDMLALELIDQNAPDFVKSAKLMSKEQEKMIPDDMYAVIMMTKTGARHKKYPLTDKAHVWLSCAAFNKTASLIPAKAAIVAATNLKSSCELFGIQTPEYISKLAASDIRWNKIKIDEGSDLPFESSVPMKKQACLKYAMSIETKGGIINKFPLDTKGNTKAAIKYFKENVGSIPMDSTVSFAKNIVDAANEFGLAIPEYLAKAATNKTGTKAAMNIRARANYSKDGKQKKALKLIAEKSKDMSATKTASYLAQVDADLGIDKKYGLGVTSPMEAVLEDFVKEAIETNTTTESSRDQEIFLPDDIDAYAATGTDNLEEFLPRDLVSKFKLDPSKTYNEMTSIQKQVIKDGMSGNL